jgi:hypothetical protein
MKENFSHYKVVSLTFFVKNETESLIELKRVTGVETLRKFKLPYSGSNTIYQAVIAFRLLTTRTLPITKV